ncbi:interleukin-33 [Hippopotamus amphibius kiboko]|uniref:interleukin-33 n=1 Tax=Hippopotamus amphibius kiboko TaxID=575201 RepID=UPI002596D736|nr:interleukin-33 [Hippopotamus amphibius kiboko]XP_057577393.1 interleukin-33 [Hippopotamus amphibius kiboko]XP_057577394.1 interleukin-33 [Hippopotamus amphibius kiboko]XP_057577395.1 interleukin-33 [Hippopotamus amphibius kiboko]XP_057577396.1 interleukin-33 [Hippopotamus amphibius kiboko]XP_057577397.1 interleukin-33 [Hippopotamus amphibius kiboko]XP_057577398.1 interleukin-33 [Hippopotamus amphibius kiboko]
MKPKMKYSTMKIPPGKMTSSAGKALVKSSKLRKSQQKAEGVCQMYFMQLRSGLKIEKKACYFRKETTIRYSPRTAEKYKEQHLESTAYQKQEHCVEDFAFGNTGVQKYTTATGLPSIKEHSASLSTYNDQSITFVFEGGSYEIYVDELGKDQEKDKVLLRYYDSQFLSSETDGGGDHRKLMVNLSPTKDKDFLLHANSKEHSVELQKFENQLPEQAFFVLHEQTSQCVSFECKSNPGVFLGVKDNHLALIKRGEHPEDSNEENTIFKLSNLI